MPKRAGALVERDSVRFTLHAPDAEAVELCLFDSPEAPREAKRLSLERLEYGDWEVVSPGTCAGDAYGFRVHGAWDPGRGHRFNAAKLLADPRARALTGELRWSPALSAAEPGSEDRRPSDADSAPFVPRSLVVADDFDWQGVRPPGTPWARSVIYECHVKGMTRLHPHVPPELRGTFLGLAEPAVIDHLDSLGITAVELLPIQHSVSEGHLAGRGLVNYFGYNPMGFFAPHEGYATAPGRQVEEFKTMVRELHRAGIEVILDVVFNHTAEGDHRGPTLCLRGIANHRYYRLVPGQPRYYENYSGCGNTLDFGHPKTVELTLDCLRYWVDEMGVDGFRFDLAPILGRREGEFTLEAPLFRGLRRDPVLSRVKLVAEPWDLGPGGYRLGGFPPEWSEWNDRFRDATRSFWRGDAGRATDLIEGLAGSPGLFRPDASGTRRPVRASVNYVTAHDGFTLADLVSYQEKHNHTNGEQNRDGHENNLSRNWGVEGPTDEPEVAALRDRARRNLLTTLALSYGVPMISHGDELGRTQLGNNNAYCHDSELTWIDWTPTRERREWLEVVRGILALRREIGSLSTSEPPGKDDFAILDVNARPFDPRRRDRGGRGDPAFATLWRSDPAWTLALFNGCGRTRLFSLPRPGPLDGAGWTPLGPDASGGTAPPEAASSPLRQAARLEPWTLLVLKAEPGSRTGSTAKC